MSGMFCFSLLLALIFLCIFAKPVYSLNQSAHIHGVAQLTLALEENTLEIQFVSPMANLVGFEHQASTSDEQHRVSEAQALLKSAQSLFSFVGTQCERKRVSLNQSNAETNKDDQHLAHTDSKENHIAHNHDSAHHQEDSEHKHEAVSHSEVTVDYRFSCNSGTNLMSVVIHLFDHFPGVEKINVMWVTQTQQGSELLHPSRNTIFLR